MEKIIVIGSPGAGKSYFSKKLHELTKIKVYYLDNIYWKENWETITKKQFHSKLSQIFTNESYIIDGNYLKFFMEERIKNADTIFFLDLDAKTCLESATKRANTKEKRDDFPHFLEDNMDEEFVNLIVNFKKETRPEIMNLLKKYKDKDVIIFKTRKEVQDYWKKLEKSLQKSKK